MRAAQQVRGGDGGASVLVGLFLALNAASFVYLLASGEYDGDFYGVPIELPLSALVLGFLASCLPFVVLRWMHRRVERRSSRFRIAVPMRFLKVFVPLLLIVQAGLTLQYQVGVIGQPAYEIDGPMRLVALLVNRFQPFYVGTFFLLVLPRRSWFEVLTIALLVWVGLLRAGLGAFLYVGLALLLKYHSPMVAFARRRWFLLTVSVCLLPIVVFRLYALRDSLRDEPVFTDYSVATLVTGIFLGRVSSLANSLVVVENAAYFQQSGQTLEQFYFQRQMLAGVFGPAVAPTQTPQSLLININGGDFENYSYMTGLLGEMQIAAQQSLLTALLNLLSALGVAWATLRVAKTFRFEQSGAFGLMLMLYPTMSGVASESAAVLYFFVLMAFVLGGVNMLSRRLHVGRRRGAVVRRAAPASSMGT